jgi:hypothetical protein
MPWIEAELRQLMKGIRMIDNKIFLDKSDKADVLNLYMMNSMVRSVDTAIVRGVIVGLMRR